MAVSNDGGGFSVSPDQLTTSGQSAQGIAGQIPGESQGILQPSDQASSGLAGWATAGALHDCTYDWQKLIDGLASDMGAYGGKLIQMAQGYQQSDQSAAGTMLAVSSSSGAAPGPGPVGAGIPSGQWSAARAAPR